MSDINQQVVLTLYTGEACHLCDLAMNIVEEVLCKKAGSVACEVISITGNAELLTLYGERIPVIKNSLGQEKSWPFSIGQISRML